MPECPGRKRLAAIGRVPRLDVPAEPTETAGDGIAPGHFFHRGLAEDAAAAVAAAFEHHLGVPGEVFRGGEQPGVPGDAAEQVRPGVVHLAQDPLSVAPFGGCGAAAERFAGQIAGLGHSQRLEDVLAGELIHVLARNPPDKLPQHEIAHVGIDEFRAGLRTVLQGEDPLPRLLGALGVVVQRVVV